MSEQLRDFVDTYKRTQPQKQALTVKTWMKTQNHEIWWTCKNCGNEQDVRLEGTWCTTCGNVITGR